MSLENDVPEQTIDDIAARLGSPDFGDFADDEKSPEITDQVMAEKGETPKINAGDLLSTMVVFGTNYLAARRGEHWVLSEDEARGLSHAIDEAMPDVEMSPMWALGAVSVGIFGPRIMTDINLSKIEEENEDEETTDTHKTP
ncbi:hypothetical protein [Pseudoalteromonas prydzensis]|uniref:hypothetical protein n=1 Tax=Pseudoalteromonas prydzensis TaxID=182141 RepID=UPI0007E4E18C|nr:hypothetical protein [Pseudoalteromonas prydzensis]MBE0378984.1 hypothetical protein [Pseudoalteromonas prydzensis ACAM 620]